MLSEIRTNRSRSAVHIAAGTEPALEALGREEPMSVQVMWILVAAIAGAAVVVYLVLRWRRTERLRRRFGPEYERTVRETGSVGTAETRLHAREQRVARLHIRPLAPDDAARFGTAWKNVQAKFVDDPEGAVTEADRLVGEVMHARGYPLGDFDQRVEDVSADHPNVVMNYRAARDIARDHASGRATTEDLRQAMVHYRALFTELLEATTAAPATEPVETPVAAERRR